MTSSGFELDPTAAVAITVQVSDRKLSVSRRSYIAVPPNTMFGAGKSPSELCISPKCFECTLSGWHKDVY